MFDKDSGRIPIPTTAPAPAPSPMPSPPTEKPHHGDFNPEEPGEGNVDWKSNEYLVTPPLPLPNPKFDVKPVPWPKPAGYEKENPGHSKGEETRPTEIDIVGVPDCDGISLALISGETNSGMFIAMKEKLLQHQDASVFLQKTTYSIKLEYHHVLGKEMIRFYLDDTPLTSEPLEFNIDSLAEGSQVSPKLTLSAATDSCTESHFISKVWFQMEKVLVPEECEFLSTLLVEGESESEKVSSMAEFMFDSKIMGFSTEENLTDSSKPFNIMIASGVAMLFLGIGFIAVKVLYVRPAYEAI
jgi:hypothetical protein